MSKPMMRAVQFQPGSPDKMFIGEVPQPQLRESEILIKVYATAINRVDVLQVKHITKLTLNNLVCIIYLHNHFLMNTVSWEKQNKIPFFLLIFIFCIM